MHPQVDDWHRLYGESWKGAIEDESFAHPAKFSRALIRRIYDHMLEEGWLHIGDTVLDPFGGVALGAWPAMARDLNWVGMELEERFVLMGNANIQRWEALMRTGGYSFGEAYLYHGDSRYLALLLDRRMGGCVSSPPYEGGCAHTGGNDPHPEHIQGGMYHGVGIAGAVSSPPYHDALKPGGKCGIDFSKLPERAQYDSVTTLLEAQASNYGASPAQLGAMPAGNFEAAVSSPPWGAGAEGVLRKDKFKDPEAFAAAMSASDGQGTRNGTTPASRLAQMERDAERVYGDSPGQLGQMPARDFEACVSSPPYEASRTDSEFQRQAANPDVDLSMPESTKGYGESGIGRVRTQEAVDTFWAAARQVLEQTYQVLAPGAHAVFVCKDFVRDKRRVPFAHQWAQLCVACGFEWLHEHRAWVVEDYGTQMGLFGEDSPIIKERKSFFRRLAEKNGSPRIDWESVLCFRKGGDYEP